MAHFNLVFYPDLVLRKQAAEVKEIDGNVNELIAAMRDIMYKNNGIGLAAPQVGYLQRIIVADIGDGPLTLINPVVLQEHGKDRKEEGCLSLPNIHVSISRKTEILVRGWDEQGKEVELELKGLIARVVQHEIDHLNGRLIIDYANTIERLKMREPLEYLEKRYKFKML